MSTSFRIRRALSFSGRVPPVIGGLIVAIFVLSLIGAVGQRNGLPLISYVMLQPEAVWQGEIWRLLTWVFFEGDPISLVFSCLMLYWFGRDLATHWGVARFLRICGGLTLAVAGVVCLAARFVWPELMHHAYVGSWTLSSALVIAWALTYPERQIMLYFVLRVGGRQLLYLELGLTALFAVFYGVPAVLHVIAAEVLMLAYMYRFWVRRRLSTLTGRLRRRRVTPDLRVWDDKKGDFRPPKWVN